MHDATPGHKDLSDTKPRTFVFANFFIYTRHKNLFSIRKNTLTEFVEFIDKYKQVNLLSPPAILYGKGWNELQ